MACFIRVSGKVSSALRRREPLRKPMLFDVLLDHGEYLSGMSIWSSYYKAKLQQKSQKLPNGLQRGHRHSPRRLRPSACPLRPTPCRLRPSACPGSHRRRFLEMIFVKTLKPIFCVHKRNDSHIQYHTVPASLQQQCCSTAALVLRTLTELTELTD